MSKYQKIGAIVHGEYVSYPNTIKPKGIPTKALPLHMFPTDVEWDTMDEHPPRITNKRQLKEECRKRGLTSRYLEDKF